TSITYTPSAAQARGSSRVFDMSFRPAALDLLDADTLPLGMPSFVPMTVNSLVAGLYAVRLHNPARLALPSRVLKPSAKVTALQDAVPVKLAPQFFPGLVLTQVLGAGGYGTAYHGG
ncbi:protein kinase domain-containing protein, partial [Haematococcus lacustris]